MAFAGRFGGLVRQGLYQKSASSAAPMASMLNAVRDMSSKLFVGGLSWGTDDQSLKEAFSTYGEVIEARVITDRDTGRSRGFGFVSYADEQSASAALGMDGQELQGRNIRVNYATERAAAPRGSGGYGGGGGGFGGGGGGGGGDFGGGY
ncbi:unnamed protein product [Rhodiola kirilowii]